MIENIIEHGKPRTPGIYAVRQYYGWRILEWHAGEGWFAGRTAKWGSGEIEGFLGPLPVISKDFSVKPKDEPEYDL